MKKKIFNGITIAVLSCGLLFIIYEFLPRKDGSVRSLYAIFRPNAPIMRFVNKSYDFGTIRDGTAITYYFHFSNTGKSPLIIYNVTTTCGCTIAAWPHKPILPGSFDSIGVVYKTHGGLGFTDKIITVQSNDVEGTDRLVFQGRVIRIYKRDDSL